MSEEFQIKYEPGVLEALEEVYPNLRWLSGEKPTRSKPRIRNKLDNTRFLKVKGDKLWFLRGGKSNIPAKTLEDIKPATELKVGDVVVIPDLSEYEYYELGGSYISWKDFKGYRATIEYIDSDDHCLLGVHDGEETLVYIERQILQKFRDRKAESEIASVLTDMQMRDEDGMKEPLVCCPYDSKGKKKKPKPKPKPLAIHETPKTRLGVPLWMR